MGKKKHLSDVAFSVLDLVPVREGFSHRSAMEKSLELAQHLEKWNYKRIWVAEHHNAPSIVSSATPLLIQYLAQGTNDIRVGSGGVMLPNHSPLVVAEQFGTLATLFPGRIDLGLGRAPGTDQLTARALRRERLGSSDDFPQDVQELQFYFSKGSANSSVKAIPGQGLEVPVYILGSSTFSAHLAAALGLPYAFASHFAPTYLFEALDIYRKEFKPSDQIDHSYAIAGANMVIAKTDAEAEFLATSSNLFALDIIRNTRRPLQPPVKNMREIWTPYEAAQVGFMRKYAFIGSPETVRKGLEKFIEETQIDELIFSSYVYDTNLRLQSFEILSQLRER